MNASCGPDYRRNVTLLLLLGKPQTPPELLSLKFIVFVKYISKMSTYKRTANMILKSGTELTVPLNQAPFWQSLGEKLYK